MIYITGRRLSPGGSRPSHITHLRATNDDGSNPVLYTRQQMVDWIDGTDGSGQKGVAKVHNRYGVDPVVHTVHPSVGSPYVQSSPDNTTTDNLLSLPPC